MIFIVSMRFGNNVRVKRENLDEWLHHDVRIMGFNLFMCVARILDVPREIGIVAWEIWKGEKIIRFNRTDGVRA